ncbi:hypothetical protein LTS18_012467, partial [Coniosporium uncinatum]
KKHAATSPLKADRQPERKKFRSLLIPKSVSVVKKLDFAEPAAVKVRSVSKGTLPHPGSLEDGEEPFGDDSHSFAESPSQALREFSSSPFQAEFAKPDDGANLITDHGTPSTSPLTGEIENDSSPFPFPWFKPGLAKTMLSWRHYLYPPLALNSSSTFSQITPIKILSITFWNTGTSSSTKVGPSISNQLISLSLATDVSSIQIFQISIPPRTPTFNDPFPHGFRTHAAYHPEQYTAILIHEHPLSPHLRSSTNPMTATAATATTSGAAAAAAASKDNDNNAATPWQMLIFPSSSVTTTATYAVDPTLPSAHACYSYDTKPGFAADYVLPRPSWHALANTAAVATARHRGEALGRIANLDFMRAGGLPLVDGFGIRSSYWRGFVEAVGCGEGGVSVVYGYGREGLG